MDIDLGAENEAGVGLLLGDKFDHRRLIGIERDGLAQELGLRVGLFLLCNIFLAVDIHAQGKLVGKGAGHIDVPLRGQADLLDRGRDIERVAPARLAVKADHAGGVAVFVRLEQRALRLALEDVRCVIIIGEAAQLELRQPVDGLRQHQRIKFFHAVLRHADKIGVIAGCGQPARHARCAAHKLRDRVAVYIRNPRSRALGQAAQRHREALVVEVGRLGIRRETASDLGPLCVKFQADGRALYARVALDRLDRDALCIQQRAGPHNVDGIGLRRRRVVARGLPARVAARDLDVHPVRNEERIAGEDLLVADIGMHLILLVHGRGHDVSSAHRGTIQIRMERDHILVDVRREGREHRQIIAVGNVECLQPLVAAAPVAAEVCAAACGRVHDPDLIARLDHVVLEALVREPAVQRAHPAGVLAVVKFLQAADLADVAVFRARLRDVPFLQHLHDGVHHGHALSHRESRGDLLALPCGRQVV